MANSVPPPPTNVALPQPEPVNELDIVDELQTSYRTYALSVIISRALPDVRDGLKPVQRRILVAMNDLGLGPNAATSKCAGIIGETMKRYHPHGDASIYDALVRMAQDWNLRYRLIHGQGNFGSIAGLPPAAHRYTEARLTPVAAELLEDLDRETVDFIDNYDGKYREPLVLPGRFPNLLVNGADGIAVGIATHIPPHNLREVCKGLIRLLDNPEVSLAELMEDIPGPDFPTGGIIMGRQGIVEAYRTGSGRITLRARAEVVEDGKGKAPVIIIREVPFQVARIPLMEEIGELVKGERITGISAVRDESSARGGEPVRIVVELKRGTDPHSVLNQLYKYTKLQKTISINMWALADGRARRLPLRELMQKFLDHRVQVIRRRTEYLLREAKRRGHILEGQLIALADIEAVIRICRTSPNREEAKRRLQALVVPASLMERALGAEAFAALQRELGTTSEYQMTEAQAEAVVRLQLGQLAALESDEILKEYAALRAQIREYETLLADEANIRGVIRADLEQLAQRYGDARKTEINDTDGQIDEEDLIDDEPNIVAISHQQLIKRMPLTEYRVQGRGCLGVKGGLEGDDCFEHFFVASTKDYLLCFTNIGRMYWLKVHSIKKSTRTGSGCTIDSYLESLQRGEQGEKQGEQGEKKGERITSIVPVRDFAEGKYLFMATRRGVVKKTELPAYSNVRKDGIIGITLDEGDELIGVCQTQPGDEVVLSTRKGMVIRFSEADVRPMGRTARGVRGITLRPDDEVVGMVVADPDGYLLTICEKGYGKRTPFGANTDPAVLPPDEAEASPDEEPAEALNGGDEETTTETDPSGMRYRLQRRSGRGVKDVKITAKNGCVVGIASVRDDDEVMLITARGMVTRIKVNTIRCVGRNTQGVRVMNLKEGDKVVQLAKVASEVVASEAPEPTAPAPTA